MSLPCFVMAGVNAIMFILADVIANYVLWDIIPIYIMFVVDIITTLYMADFIAIVADGIATCTRADVIAPYITSGTAKCDS